MPPNTDNVGKRLYTRKYSSSQVKFMKEMNFIKATKINTINFEMKKKMEKLKIDYEKKIMVISNMKNSLGRQ